MHIPACCFSTGVESFECLGFTLVGRTNTTHRVVLSRTNRDPLFRRIDPQEVFANLFYFPEIFFDVFASQYRDVEPEVIAIVGLGTLSFAYMFCHPATDDIPGGQLLFVWFVVRHKAVTIFVEQESAVSAAALGCQDSYRYDRGRVKLYRFHISQSDDPCLQCNRLAHSLTDDGVGRNFIDSTIASSGDSRCLGDISDKFSIHKISRDGAVTAPIFM